MNEPLSCVKCGAPRTPRICAYCGTRYDGAERNDGIRISAGPMVRTSLTIQCSPSDTTISVASATGMAVGRWIMVDSERMSVADRYQGGTMVPVNRHLDGTVAARHHLGAGVVHGGDAIAPAWVIPRVAEAFERAQAERGLYFSGTTLYGLTAFQARMACRIDG